MLGNVQAVAVFLLFILPGYVWTKSENVFRPKHRSILIDTIAHSLTRSVIINTPALVVLTLYYHKTPASKISEYVQMNPMATLSSLALYTLIALAGGFTTGYLQGALYPKFSFRALIAKNGITQQLDATSVWENVMVSDNHAPEPPPGQLNAAWVVATFTDGSQIHGKIESYPQIVLEDKPFWFSVSTAVVYSSEAKPLPEHTGHHIIMIHSEDIRHISVRYVPANALVTPSVTGPSRKAISTLLLWPWFWTVSVTLLVASIAVRCIL